MLAAAMVALGTLALAGLLLFFPIEVWHVVGGHRAVVVDVETSSLFGPPIVLLLASALGLASTWFWRPQQMARSHRSYIGIECRFQAPVRVSRFAPAGWGLCHNVSAPYMRLREAADLHMVAAAPGLRERGRYRGWRAVGYADCA